MRAMARVKVAEFSAVGGPAKLQHASDGFVAGPTDAGKYRIHSIRKHSSPSYPTWSKIKWGSEVKDIGGEIHVMHDGRFQLLSVLSPALTRQSLLDRNLQLYNSYTLPTQWLFNDFGHITCYFYKDLNNNRKLDADEGEHIHREYFHTTPDNEAETARGLPVTLAPSHGCIHLKPNDIDTLIGKGYFKAGNRVVVHGYKVKAAKLTLDTKGKRPFEVHFYPGEEKLIVTGQWSKK